MSKKAVYTAKLEQEYPRLQITKIENGYIISKGEGYILFKKTIEDVVSATEILLREMLEELDDE